MKNVFECFYLVLSSLLLPKLPENTHTHDLIAVDYTITHIATQAPNKVLLQQNTSTSPHMSFN